MRNRIVRRNRQYFTNQSFGVFEIGDRRIGHLIEDAAGQRGRQQGLA